MQNAKRLPTQIYKPSEIIDYKPFFQLKKYTHLLLSLPPLHEGKIILFCKFQAYVICPLSPLFFLKYKAWLQFENMKRRNKSKASALQSFTSKGK